MSQRNRTHRVYVDSACITTYIGDASIFIYTYVSTYVCISTLTSVSVLYRSTYILRDRQTARAQAGTETDGGRAPVGERQSAKDVDRARGRRRNLPLLLLPHCSSVDLSSPLPSGWDLHLGLP